MPAGLDRVQIKGIVKVYGATRALSGVDAELAAGEVTVIEGPNGSGKSTLLNILGQLVRPTRGEVLYDGRAAVDDVRARARVGILAHSAMIYPDLSGRENLALFADLYGVADVTSAVERLASRFEIGAWSARPARTYSRGQLQRIALARALVHEPALLLLDEPSTGLDARGVERLVRAVDEERVRGAVVVLITHDSGLADALGQKRVRLERGRVVESTASAAEPA